MSTRSKGNARERQCVQTLEEAGWHVHKKVNNTYDSGDMFELFDCVSLRKGYAPIFIQVKSNRTDGALKAISEAEFVDPAQITPEVWVFHDREGWRVKRLTEDGWETIVDERDNGMNTTEETIKLYSE